MRGDVTKLRILLAVLAALVLVVAGTNSLVNAPRSSAATTVEAEALSWNRGALVNDANATNGTTWRTLTNATGTGVYTTDHIDSVVVRAREQACTSAVDSNIRVSIDGVSLGDQGLTHAYADYVFPANVSSGTHTVTLQFTNDGGICSRDVFWDDVTLNVSSPPTTTTTTTTTMPSTTTTTTTTTPPTTTTTVPPGNPIFNGDYSTGNFSQWDSVQNVDYNSGGATYTPKLHTNSVDGQTYYPLSLQNDPTYGKAARFEVHGGDYPGFVSGDRSEVGDNSGVSGGSEGQTRWYHLAIKLDQNFPADHTYPNWASLSQWHMTGAGGSGPFGITAGEKGQITLVVDAQSAPMTFLGNNGAIWETPYANGQWHDFIIKVVYSTSDSIGQIQLWHNGVQQTFIDHNNWGTGAGTTTYHIRTLVPNAGGSVYYKEGYYRARDIPTPGVVYHAGFRSAATRADLGY
jgi:hypothetical protein